MKKVFFIIFILINIIQPKLGYSYDLRTNIGYGLTVFKDNKISTFEVEIMGKLKNNKFNEELKIGGDSYLIKVSGEEIEKNGGISQGMSGSPIYIDNRLVGAISSTWAMTNHNMGLMIPIGKMRTLFKYDKKYKQRLNISKKIKNLSTPIFINGLNDKNIDRLRTKLKNVGYKVMKNFSMNKTHKKIDMKAGQAIGIMLASGDINITTIGTLTEIKKDGSYIALGHPFLKRGRVSYFLAPVSIFHTFNSMEFPFKIGVPLSPVGSVTEDRNEGIMGKIGVMPRVIHLKIKVYDKKENREGEIKCSIVRDPLLISEIVTSSLMQAIDNVADRELEESVKINFSASLQDIDGEIVNYSRTNSGGFSDAKSFLENEVLHSIDGLLNNPHKKLIPLDMNIVVTISKKKQLQMIKDVTVENDDINPGDDISLKIIFERFRREDYEKTVKLQIPQNISSGEYNISINCGSEYSNTLSEMNGSRKKEKTFATYLDKLSNGDKNDLIYITLTSSNPENFKEKNLNKIKFLDEKYAKFLKRLRKNIEDKKIINNYIARTTLKVDIPTSGSHDIKLSFGTREEEEIE